MNARRGPRARLFAWALTRAAPVHDRLVADRKRALLGDLAGDVLEVGPGTGVNFAYFPSGVRWIGVEPNSHLRRQVAEAARRCGVRAAVRDGTAERLPVPDASVDAVVATLVLCSVRDLGEALREIRRVLRPGGRFVFVEHVSAPPGTWLRRLQRWIRPLWSLAAGGCRPDRDTLEAIRRAGFARVDAERFAVPAGIVGPHVAGIAYESAGAEFRTRERIT
jgi:ubiquinone/menaquinone biosynthesis C-methylase UbiE